jgi:hypothetical protein
LLRHGSFVVAAVAAIAAVLFLLAVAIHQLAG